MVPANGADHPVLSLLTDQFDCSTFDCGDDEEVTSLFRTQARANHQMSLNLTRVLHLPTDLQVLGFVTMSMGQVRIVLEGAPARPVGCIHVAYLGIQKEHHGKGWGTLLLAFVVNEAVEFSERIGCRGVALNCRDKRLSWYEERGFVRYDIGKDTGGPLNKMFFDIRSPDVDAFPAPPDERDEMPGASSDAWIR